MSRMTLQQWQERNRPRMSKASVKKLRIELFNKAIRRYLLDKGLAVKKPPKAKKRWSYQYDDPMGSFEPLRWTSFSGVVEAHTRSEARSEIKKQLSRDLDIRIDRLPTGIVIKELANGPESTVGAA